MKKFIILSAIMAACLSDFAQGTVDFQNGALQAVYISDGYATNKATSGTIDSQVGGGDTGVIDVGLVYGATAGTVTNLAGVAHIGTIFPGLIAGDANFPLSGTNPNDVEYIQVYVWDSSYGNDLNGMYACIAGGGFFCAATGTPGLYGSIGAPLSFVLGATPGPGTPIFNTIPGYFHSMLLAPVPEPMTVALGGLGALALLLARRRGAS